ncbi:uncharacterized protein LOC125262827 [Megalobrama amblycephala]|uniref:uncharacterized protein LOC125262827 n=1 Tax=Megalobrama amblycephala TaxID=75352 RepID=UPI002013D854|nr:uncharacterized protein LOC125262827 [Megalobrama amblycephala]
MKTLLLSLLCVFVWSQHTEGLTDQQVTLGQSVTVTCEFRLRAITWFVIKSSARPVMIWRTFASEKPIHYYDEKFRSKYSEGSRSQLIINNVTADDLGIYYCIIPGETTLEVSDGIRLDTGGAHQNFDELEEQNPPQDQRSYRILIVIFTLLIVMLSAAVIGLLMMNRKLSQKIPKYVNGHQISERRITSFPTSGTVVPPQNSLTDREYQEILPESTYELATY